MTARPAARGAAHGSVVLGAAQGSAVRGTLKAMRPQAFLAAFAAAALAGGSASAQTANPWASGPAAAPQAPLSAGGLVAPPPGSGPAEPPPASTTTERQLEQAEKSDSGRGLEWLWLNAEVGPQMVGLQTLSAGSNPLVPSVGSVSTNSTGTMVGVGAGLRLVFLTLGPRVRVARFSDWDMWSINGELGLHLPLGALEPYFTFGGGYTKVGNAADAKLGSADAGVKMQGYDVRVGFGLDYYVTPTFTVGANVTAEALMLSRPGVDPTTVLKSGTNVSACQSAPDPQACVTAKAYQADGSGIGLAVSPSVVLGLHF